MFNSVIKRIFDLIFSITSLIVISPILVIVIPLLFFTGENKVFYFQDRVGFKNKIFKIWKFVTMLSNSPNIGTGSLTLRNDPRVLFVGKFLRKTKINELPQFINVLIGNMSVVGPRPQMKVDFEKFPLHIQKNIYNIKPGITGIGSIVFRDEEYYISQSKNPHKFYKEKIAPYKGELEIWYQENQNIFIDIKLILLTMLVVLFPKLNINHFFNNLPQNSAFK